MHFRYEHDFDVDAQGYWDLFLSEEFSIHLFRTLRMKDRQLLERTDDGKVLRRVQRMSPSTEIPAFLRSVVSDLSYTETDVYRRDRSEMDVIVEPAMLRSKFDLRGLYSVKALGPARCRRIFEGDIKVSIMLVGGQVEKMMVDEMRTSYDTAARLVREWLARPRTPA